MSKILIVEDEPKIARLLKSYLEVGGFRVTVCKHSNNVISRSLILNPDLVLFDVMESDNDGLSLCRELRLLSDLPVILLTAHGEDSNRLKALEWAADDYICKPFSAAEVVDRVTAVLKRTKPTRSSRAEASARKKILVLDTSQRRALLGELSLDLSILEFALLTILCETPERIFSRQELVEHIAPNLQTVNDRTVDIHIKKLRKKLTHLSNEELIQSVYGKGYRYQLAKEG